MRSRARLPRDIVPFIVVGCTAAAVHWLAVVGLVSGWRWHPLVANVLGWAVAFGVSFGGHHRWTFRGHGVAMPRAAARLFVISATGFAINEALYAVLLRWTAHRYDLLLGAVLIIMAVLTYLLSRHWAFLRIPAR